MVHLLERFGRWETAGMAYGRGKRHARHATFSSWKWSLRLGGGWLACVEQLAHLVVDLQESDGLNHDGDLGPGKDSLGPIGLASPQNQQANARMFRVGRLVHDFPEHHQTRFARGRSIHNERVERLLSEALQRSGRLAGKQHAKAEGAEALADDIAHLGAAFDEEQHRRLDGGRFAALLVDGSLAFRPWHRINGHAAPPGELLRAGRAYGWNC